MDLLSEELRDVTAALQQHQLRHLTVGHTLFTLVSPKAAEVLAGALAANTSLEGCTIYLQYTMPRALWCLLCGAARCASLKSLMVVGGVTRRETVYLAAGLAAFAPPSPTAPPAEEKPTAVVAVNFMDGLQTPRVREGGVCWKCDPYDKRRLRTPPSLSSSPHTSPRGRPSRTASPRVARKDGALHVVLDFNTISEEGASVLVEKGFPCCHRVASGEVRVRLAPTDGKSRVAQQLRRAFQEMVQRNRHAHPAWGCTLWKGDGTEDGELGGERKANVSPRTPREKVAVASAAHMVVSPRYPRSPTPSSLSPRPPSAAAVKPREAGRRAPTTPVLPSPRSRSSLAQALRVVPTKQVVVSPRRPPVPLSSPRVASQGPKTEGRTAAPHLTPPSTSPRASREVPMVRRPVREMRDHPSAAAAAPPLLGHHHHQRYQVNGKGGVTSPRHQAAPSPPLSGGSAAATAAVQRHRQTHYALEAMCGGGLQKRTERRLVTSARIGAVLPTAAASAREVVSPPLRPTPHTPERNVEEKAKRTCHAPRSSFALQHVSPEMDGPYTPPSKKYSPARLAMPRGTAHPYDVPHKGQRQAMTARPAREWSSPFVYKEGHTPSPSPRRPPSYAPGYHATATGRVRVDYFYYHPPAAAVAPVSSRHVPHRPHGERPAPARKEKTAAAAAPLPSRSPPKKVNTPRTPTPTSAKGVKKEPRTPSPQEAKTRPFVRTVQAAVTTASHSPRVAAVHFHAKQPPEGKEIRAQRKTDALGFLRDIDPNRLAAQRTEKKPTATSITTSAARQTPPPPLHAETKTRPARHVAASPPVVRNQSPIRWAQDVGGDGRPKKTVSPHTLRDRRWRACEWSPIQRTSQYQSCEEDLLLTQWQQLFSATSASSSSATALPSQQQQQQQQSKGQKVHGWSDTSTSSTTSSSSCSLHSFCFTSDEEESAAEQLTAAAVVARASPAARVKRPPTTTEADASACVSSEGVHKATPAKLKEVLLPTPPAERKNTISSLHTDGEEVPVDSDAGDAPSSFVQRPRAHVERTTIYHSHRCVPPPCEDADKKQQKQEVTVRRHVDASVSTGSDNTAHHSDLSPTLLTGDVVCQTSAEKECAAAAATEEAPLGSTQMQIHTNKHPLPPASCAQWVVCSPDLVPATESTTTTTTTEKEKEDLLQKPDPTVAQCLCNIKQAVQWYQIRSSHEAHYMMESVEAMNDVLVSRVEAELEALQRHFSAAVCE